MDSIFRSGLVKAVKDASAKYADLPGYEQKVQVMRYSIPEHVPFILNGVKTQTTRRPRIYRPIKVGDVICNCFECPDTLNTCETPKTCDTCISPCEKVSQEIRDCLGWSNYFGPVEVVQVVRLRQEDENTFVHWSLKDLKAWAIADGFQDLKSAIDFFEGHYGNEWDYMDFDIIHFVGKWVKPSQVGGHAKL